MLLSLSYMTQGRLSIKSKISIPKVFAGTRPNLQSKRKSGQVSGGSTKGRRVFVGMSGGVDSSVAAMLLKNQGYDVTGVYLKCYVQPDRSCLREAMDAMEVAEKLGIPFHIWDFQKEYKERVINYMIDGYRAGRTPNPDIECNREIKFGMFLEKALKWGADFVATGHYVRREPEFSSINSQFSKKKPNPRLEIENYKLKIAKDFNKDQSYFLWTLTQAQLKHALFPIGDYLKPEAREMAKKAGLSTAEKKDSQGICFLGKVSLDEFLKEYLPEKRGEVLNVAGEKLGEHNGAHFYTIGQRHIGVRLQVSGVSQKRKAEEEGKHETKPVYVASKDIKKNTLTVAEEGDENLTQKEVELTGVNFINPEHSHILENVRMLKVMARVRYRQPLTRACIMYHVSRKSKTEENSKKQTKLRLVFDKPQKFVAKGQSAVFYLPAEASAKEGGLEMIGGGIIL